MSTKNAAQVRQVNLLSGNSLNRLSWKRSDAHFVNSCVQENAHWILFDKGQPLINRSLDGRSTGLAYLTTEQVRPLLGSEPFFEQHKSANELAGPGSGQLESARFRGPRLVFLGTSVPEGIPARVIRCMVESEDIYKHVSYFAFDISGFVDPKDSGPLLKSLTSEGSVVEFAEPRSVLPTLSDFDGSIFAEARSMVDWNLRNKFCPACGKPSFSLWAGWKLTCTSTLFPIRSPPEAEPCPSSSGLQNFMHPRTDAVVIVAVISSSGEEILLGRNKKFPKSMYSALAGFLEPGETLEAAVKREVMEESGVSVKDVQYHSTQPWPYPSNVMLGCYAVAEEETIDLLDDELEDAKFFSKEEVLKVLNHPQGTIIRRREYKQFDEGPSSLVPTGTSQRDEEAPIFRVPPTSAIAGVLISEWAFDRVKLKANL